MNHPIALFLPRLASQKPRKGRANLRLKREFFRKTRDLLLLGRSCMAWETQQSGKNCDILVAVVRKKFLDGPASWRYFLPMSLVLNVQEVP